MDEETGEEVVVTVVVAVAIADIADGEDDVTDGKQAESYGDPITDDNWPVCNITDSLWSTVCSV